MNAVQKELQRGLKDTWNKLDKLDIETQKTILTAVKQIRQELVDRLIGLPVTTLDSGVEAWQATYLQAYNSELTQLIDRWAADLSQQTGKLTQQAAELGSSGIRAALEPALQAYAVPGAPIHIPTIGVGADLVRAAVLYDSSVIKGVAGKVAEKVNYEIQRTVFGGQDRWTAIRNIREAMAAEQGWAGKKIPPGKLGQLTNSAMRAERTAIMSVFNAASEQTLKGAKEELPELMSEWVTAKDKRTDPDCVALNGKRKNLDGGTFPGGIHAPPKHLQCRCRTMPWMPGWD